MEAMSGCLSFPILTQDLAIRRFCPARINQQQAFGGTEGDQLCSLNYTNTTPQLPTSEEEEFADSFFNMECLYDEKDSNKVFDNFHDELIQIFSVGNDFYDEEMEMMSTYFQDSGDVVLEILPSHGVDQGLQLVHMLLTCAEAVGCRDTQLADSLINQIWPLVSPWGDSLHRVSYCFAMGLKSRLTILQNPNANCTFTTNSNAIDASLVSREEKMEAFQLLHQTTPYIAFGFMAANDAISQASKGNDSLHIIDLGTEHTLQWPSLIRTLASRSGGPPKSLRITGILEDGQNPSLDLKTSVKCLTDEAGSLGISLQFHIVSEPATPLVLTKENLDLREGEALFVNSIMHLHKFVKESRGSLKTILQSIKKLGPTLVTVVEQDANHNGPFFLGRFVESLHYYSAIFDSLESCLPRNSLQRTKIEILHFAEEIRNIIAREGSDRIERHERADQWRRQLGRAGFQVVGLKSMSQARMMLDVYGCDGYTLASDKGCLLLGWKGRPIMLASAWQLHNSVASDTKFPN